MARETTTDPHGFLGGHSTATADYNSWTLWWGHWIKIDAFFSCTKKIKFSWGTVELGGFPLKISVHLGICSLSSLPNWFFD